MKNLPKVSESRKPAERESPSPDAEKDSGSAVNNVQGKRKYYYDDAYGYEDYQPDDEDNDDVSPDRQERLESAGSIDPDNLPNQTFVVGMTPKPTTGNNRRIL